MPAVTPPADDYFANTIKQILARITALETQQNFGVRDNNGNLRVQGGLLPNGDYGLAVYSTDGSYAEINPPKVSYIGTAESTTSATPVDLATVGPSVTAHVGASGNALVTFSAQHSGALYISTAAVTVLYVDGVRWNLAVTGFNTNVTTGNVTTSAFLGASVVVSGLSTGPHTFLIRYQADGTHSSSFSQRTLIVQAI